MEKRLIWDLNVSDISVISGIRACGRATDKSGGRKDNGIFYVFNGEAAFFEESGRSVVAKSGELLFIPKGSRYRMKYTAESTTFVLVNFKVASVDSGAPLFSENISVIACDDDRFRVAKIMTGFELCASHKSLGAAFRKKELFYRLVGWLCEASGARDLQRDVDPKIVEGVRLLERTYLENLPITSFAEASHISINSFRTLFRKQFGVSPVRYRNYLRIERAKELLREGSLSIAEVAYASGFENIGYFCRYYQREVGETPSETKNANQ